MPIFLLSATPMNISLVAISYLLLLCNRYLTGKDDRQIIASGTEKSDATRRACRSKRRGGERKDKERRGTDKVDERGVGRVDERGVEVEAGAVSHIIVDEVHERSIDSDFLLIILKDLLRHRPDVKLVLMSATINANIFAEYFAEFGVSVCDIPGRTFPVKRMYLEDAIELSKYICDPRGDFARNINVASQTSVGASVGAKRGGRGRGGERREEQRGRGGRGRDGGRGGGGGGGKGGGVGRGVKHNSTIGAIAERYISPLTCPQEVRSLIGTQYSAKTADAIYQMDMNAVDPLLVVGLCRSLVNVEANRKMYGGGAILVFLPGLAEITDVHSLMQSDEILRDSKRFWIFPLHSLLSTSDQKKVFMEPPKGCIKIVLSTNIAETSVTINDITAVIDCGTHKEMQYDPSSGMSCLVETRISLANAAQRAGRAGRVKEGIAFHLYLSLEEKEMAPQQLPEMLRCPLETVCLRIKVCDFTYPHIYREIER